MAVPANWLNGIYVAVFTKEKYPAGAERHCFGAALLYLSWRWWELESHRAVQPYLACGLLNWICLNHHHSLLPLFKMDAARLHLEKALDTDPGFVQAYVYLARIWLGSDYLSRAWRTIQTALQLAPHEAEVLSTAGFVRLGRVEQSPVPGFPNMQSAVQ